MTKKMTNFLNFIHGVAVGCCVDGEADAGLFFVAGRWANDHSIPMV